MKDEELKKNDEDQKSIDTYHSTQLIYPTKMTSMART